MRTTGLDKLKTSWLAELPELDGEDWEDIWEYPFSQLMSSRDRLVQLKILHRFSIGSTQIDLHIVGVAKRNQLFISI